jgi:hypothetical protein
MKNKTHISRSIGLIVLMGLAIIPGCKHTPPFVEIIDDGGGGPPDTTWVNPDPCDPDSVYFYNTILPLLVSNCALEACHDAVDPEEDVELYDYAHIMQEVDPGDPWNSEIVEAITESDPDKIMPPLPPDGNGPLDQADIDLIVQWIQQGAEDNECVADCDPNAAVTYSGTIYPIIDNACQGCHSGTNPEGGLSLVTYAQISANALSGDLMNSLLGTNGFSLMPDNTTGIPQCNIDQIAAWIDAGAPEN